MDALILYALEFVAILFGVILAFGFIINRKKKFDQGSLYLCVLGAIYIWIVVMAMHLFGIELGFVLGIIGGAVAVMMMDTAVGMLYRSGY
jgi:uncharacterized membrane protein